MVLINGREYDDNEQIPWDIAQQVGGFYFSRAEYLGLPPPPAAFVAPGDSKTAEQMQIIGRYHAAFSEAEADKMDDLWHAFG